MGAVRATASFTRFDSGLNAICPYYTMFPLEFPLGVLTSAERGSWVLDPFCGRGTTLLAARMLGLNAVGVDSNPMAAAASAAKLVAVTPDSVVRRADQIMRRAASTVEVPSGRFWELCFAPEVLTDLCRLRDALHGSTRRVDVALRAIILGALHGPRNKSIPSYFSNQMPRTYATKPVPAVRFWERHDMYPEPVDVLDVIRRHAERRYAVELPVTDGRVVAGDARQVLGLLRRKFDWVVTSPPYPGMATYRPDQWLRNWFVGGVADVDYSRRGQLGGETGDRFSRSLSEVWAKVAARCNPGATLVVRFGGLPSTKRAEPEDVLARSLELSGRWDVVDLRSAGLGRGRRQAKQFIETGEHVEEVDCLARRRD